jgi:hypothetical protein
MSIKGWMTLDSNQEGPQRQGGYSPSEFQLSSVIHSRH